MIERYFIVYKGGYVMATLYFIGPAVFLVLTVAFSFCINQRVAHWINVDIGNIHSEDIIKMTSKQRSYLQRKVRIYFNIASIVVLAISIIFYLFSHTKNSILSILACNTICTLVGAFIALSVIKLANKLKKELDCESNKE